MKRFAWCFSALAGAMLVTGCSQDEVSTQRRDATAVNETSEVVGSFSANSVVAAKQRPHGAADPHINLGPDQYAMVALGHLDEGRVAEALASITTAISLHSDSASLYAVRAQIYARKNQQTAALSDLEKAVSLDKSNPNHYVNRATVYSKFDRDDEALEDLNHAISLDPNLLAARFNRGSLRFIREDHAGALEDFEHCIVVDPHTAAPYFNRAAVYDSIGEREMAVSDLERFLQLAQESSWKKTAQDLLDSWTKSSVLSNETDQSMKG